MEILPTIQSDIDKILTNVDFKEGSHYIDFDPDLNNVAAYGIGGLIKNPIL